MRFLHLTIIRLSIFFLLGIVLGFYLSVDSKVAVVIGFGVFTIFLISFFIASKNNFFKTIYWFSSHILMFCIGFGTSTFSLVENQENHYIHYVKDNYQSIQAEIDNEFKDSDYYQKFVLAIHQINDRKVHGKALLKIPQKYQVDSLNIGDKILFNAYFQEFREAKNPQVFNYPKFMKHQEIYRYITFQDNREFFLIAKDSFNLLRWAEELRDKIEVSLLKAGFEKQQVNVIKALILGQKQDLKKSTYQKFTDAGIVHILAVSGLHVGIVLLILQYLFKPLNYIKNGKILRLILILFFLWSFALMAGFSPSVVRASLMFSLFAFATDIFKRRTNTMNLLALSMIFILIFYPKMIFQVGFQLSYTAVFGIIMLFPNLFKLYQPRYRLDKLIWSVVCVTISAQLAILPLGLYYFHQFPGLFIVANVLVIPFLGIILSAGFIAIGLSLLEMMPEFLVMVVSYILDGLLYVTEAISQYDSFLIKYIYFDNVMLVLSSVGLFCFLIYQRSFQKRLLLLSGLSIAAFLLYFHQLKPDLFKQKAYVFHVIANSHIGFAKEHHFQIFTSDTSLHKKDYLIRNIQLKHGKKQINIDTLRHFYSLTNDQNLVVIDKSAIYQSDWIKGNIVLLRDSPKINLNRLIGYQPHQIIADGSNYTSFVKRWKETAEEQNADFYSTADKGFWELEILKDEKNQK